MIKFNKIHLLRDSLLNPYVLSWFDENYYSFHIEFSLIFFPTIVHFNVTVLPFEMSLSD